MLAAHNYADALEYLIACNSDINAQTLNGLTPLHRAISQQSFAAVRILVLSGADCNLEDENGVTPIMLAEKNQTSRGNEILKFILDNKA